MCRSDTTHYAGYGIRIAVCCIPHPKINRLALAAFIRSSSDFFCLLSSIVFSCGVFNKRAASYVLFVACRKFLLSKSMCVHCACTPCELHLLRGGALHCVLLLQNVHGAIGTRVLESKLSDTRPLIIRRLFLFSFP